MRPQHTRMNAMYEAHMSRASVTGTAHALADVHVSCPMARCSKAVGNQVQKISNEKSVERERGKEAIKMGGRVSKVTNNFSVMKT